MNGPATFFNLHEVWDGEERRQDDPDGVSGYALAETDGYRRRSAVGDLFLGPYPAMIAALTSKRTSQGLLSGGRRIKVGR